MAAIEMVYGHSLDVFLTTTSRSGTGFQTWTEFRGLTSVAFLFVSGFSFFRAASQAKTAHADTPMSLLKQKRFRRGWTLIAIGYLIHPPNFHRIHQWRGWLPFFEVDVLQCTGSLIVLFETVWVLSRSHHILALVAALSVPLALMGPLTLENMRFPPWSRPLSNYLQHTEGSLFPIIPWCMHFSLGYLVAYSLKKRTAAKHAPVLIVWTAAMQLLVHMIWYKGWMPSSPGWTALISISRLLPGVVAGALGCWALGVADKRIDWLAPFTRHTLVIYLVHMQLLFNLFWGLRRYYNRQLNWIAGLALATLILIVSLSAAWYYARWERVKKSAPKPGS